MSSSAPRRVGCGSRPRRNRGARLDRRREVDNLIGCSPHASSRERFMVLREADNFSVFSTYIFQERVYGLCLVVVLAAVPACSAVGVLCVKRVLGGRGSDFGALFFQGKGGSTVVCRSWPRDLSPAHLTGYCSMGMWWCLGSLSQYIPYTR
ncbi:unnamed protein product [Ectocarpus sp. 6 AP-2014]